MPTDWKTVKVRPDLYEKVVEAAGEDRRSVMSWVELALEQALMPAMVPMGGQPTPTLDLKRGEVRVPKRVAYYGSSASIPAPEATPESSSPAPPDPDTASTMECPNAPDHPLGWSERRGYVCAVCVNTKAVPR